MRKVVAAATVAALLGGCASEPTWTAAPECPAPQSALVKPATLSYANPIFIPIADPQRAWEQVVEVVSAYFRIEREEPVRMAGDTPTEGRIVTVPEVSPTIFEPWRNDTVDSEQRIENTLQSMRRRAVIRVIRAEGGHWVDVAVFKELENVVRPEHAMAGAATFRYDNTLTRIENPILGDPIANGWIARGRDVYLEQYMIGDLLSRFERAPKY
jgi:hypothetical protein